jgi:3-isopropylmalate dehydrogenase
VKAKKIAVLPGDGIGPETVAEALKALRAAEAKFGAKFDIEEFPVGGAAYDMCGDCLPDETLAAAKGADAVLLGAVGGPKWDSLAPEQRPERRALLTLRSELGLFANLRPVKIWKTLAAASPLKEEIVSKGIDLVIARELCGDVYFGRHATLEGGKSAIDEMPYSVFEVERIARAAFGLARRRRGKVSSVDKANVLATSRLWRETVERVGAEEFPDVALEHLYVDNAAMQLVRDPSRFDVVLTGTCSETFSRTKLRRFRDP